MKRITIIGTGLGISTMTSEAIEAIKQADVLFGSPRVLKEYKSLESKTYPFYLPNEVAEILIYDDAQEFAVLVSGDVGFYSAAAGFLEVLAAFDYEIRLVPGVSTVNAFFAKLKLPWQDAAFVSAHGREMNVVDIVRRNHLTFCLTGNNVNEIGRMLDCAGFGRMPGYVGENLGMDEECVYVTVASELKQGDYPSLTVLLFINEAFDSRTPYGLPDDCFSRAPGIPMTKSETRAVILSKLNLRPADICWDIGAGTGSVTVEMALNAYSGRVFAVERREEGISLVEQNCSAFHIGNVKTVCGEAPSVLAALPVPDAVFIGGSGGKIQEIIDIILQKNSDVRIVVTAVTIETIVSTMECFTKSGLEPEFTQISVARSKPVGNLHMMEAQNPVTIINAGVKR